MRPSCYN